MTPVQLQTIAAVFKQSTNDAYGFMRLMEKYQVMVPDVMQATGQNMSQMKAYFYGMGGAPDGWRGLESNFSSGDAPNISNNFGLTTPMILGIAGVAAFLILRK